MGDPSGSTRRGRGMRPLAGAVAKLTRPAFAGRGFADGALPSAWPTIVGERLAADSAPEKVTFPAGRRVEGTLHLRVAGGGLATELQHLEPVLIERINTYFGYRAVARLRFVQGPVPRRPANRPPPLRPLDAAEEARLARVLEPVDDAELRGALLRLGRAVAGRTR